MKEWWLARLQERSTITALLTVAGGFLGRQIAPEYADALTLLAMTAAGGIAVATKEQRPPTERRGVASSDR